MDLFTASAIRIIVVTARIIVIVKLCGEVYPDEIIELQCGTSHRTEHEKACQGESG